MPESHSRTNPFIYLLAFACSLLSGWANQMVDDALLTALCMVGFAMLFGAWKPERPWRWVLIVWIGVPIVLAYYQFVMKWPHDRGQVYGAFLQIFAASAGGFGGHFMRRMIENVFLKKRTEKLHCKWCSTQPTLILLRKGQKRPGTNRGRTSRNQL